jgi:adenosylcobinamide-GDP ribazoletransferase
VSRRLNDPLAALQFLTRVSFAPAHYRPDLLSRAAVYFPLVGLAIGAAAALLNRLLTPHLSRPICALLLITFLVLLTGGLHEDGLADVADAFGGGWDRAQILRILKDSRIGSFGAIALALSLGARWLLLVTLPVSRFAGVLISAHVLCRWTVLPLSHFLKSARGEEGQAARIANKVGWTSMAIGSVLAFGIVVFMLRTQCLPTIAAAIVATLLTGVYYQRRIGGVTGDCFGATIQLTEIAVYLCGVWNV